MIDPEVVAELGRYRETFGPLLASGESPMGRWLLYGRIDERGAHHGVVGPGGSGGAGGCLLPFEESWDGRVMGHFGGLCFSGASYSVQEGGTLVANLNRQISGVVSTDAFRVQVELVRGERVEAEVVDVGNPRGKFFVAFWHTGEDWIRLLAIDEVGFELESRSR